MISKSYSNLSPKRGWSWETPPEKIAEEKILETLTADVVIIGAGISGLAAAARCTQRGLNTIVLDRLSNLFVRVAQVGVLDSAVMRRCGVSIDKKKFARDWVMVSGSRCNEELMWVYIKRSGEAFDWMMDQGGDAVDATLYTGYYKGEVFNEYPGTHWVFQKDGYNRYTNRKGGQLIGEILQKTVIDGGSRIIRSVRAVELEKNVDGRVTSVVAKNENEGTYFRCAAKKGVIVATGDIEGDREMMEAFAPQALRPTIERYFPKGNNTGDGHKMLYWAGAALESPGWAIALHGRRDEYASYYSFYFLFVNSRGKRFMNEDTWTNGKSMAVLSQPGGDFAFTIMDGKWLDEFGERFEITGGQAVMPLNLTYFGDKWTKDCGLGEEIEQYVEKGKCAWKADTIEELAEKIGVPADTLTKTVARYNELAERGDDEDFGKRAELLTTIVQPPFYALKWGPALLDVFGGALVDTNMRVLDPYHEPIPGLYAVGNAAGGFCGIDYPLLLNGNSSGRALTCALTVTEGIEADNR